MNRNKEKNTILQWGIILGAVSLLLAGCGNNSSMGAIAPSEASSSTSTESGISSAVTVDYTITPWQDSDTYLDDLTITKNTTLSSNVSDARFCGFYAYKNLTIVDNVGLYSSGISQLVIKVQGTLTLGKNSRIQVRNGFYPKAPEIDIASLNAENLNTNATLFRNIYLYPNTYGIGGDGGDGGTGVSGTSRYISRSYTIKGHGGSGGGGGGGGYGGGNGGAGGDGGSGPGGSGHIGKTGSDNGGDGGYGGANSMIGTGGGAKGIGTYAGQPQDDIGGGGGGGGGNGGIGGHGGTSSAYYGGGGGAGRGGEGGGGGGYGGGVLVIAAKNIVYDVANPPLFVVSGQVGGTAESRATSGKNGNGGMLIILTETESLPATLWNVNTALQTSYDNGGHGTVIGSPEALFVNGIKK